MKIAIVSRTFDSGTWSEVASDMSLLASSLVELDHQVHVITSAGGSRQPTRQTFGPLTIHRLWGQPDGVRPIRRRATFAIEAARLVVELSRSGRIDVVHATAVDGCAGTLAVLRTLNRLQCAIVASAHPLSEQNASHLHRHAAHEHAPSLLCSLERAAFQLSDCITCASPMQATWINRLPNIATKPISVGAPLRIDRCAMNDRRLKQVCAIGPFDAQRGLEPLVDAWNQLDAPDWSLVIAGEDRPCSPTGTSMRQWLLEKLHESRAQTVRFISCRTPDEAARHCDRSLIVAAPGCTLDPDRPSASMISLGIASAMSDDVATGLSGVTCDAVHTTGDPKSLRESLVRIMRKPEIELIESGRTQGRQVSALCSTHRFAARCVEGYQMAIERQRGQAVGPRAMLDIWRRLHAILPTPDQRPQVRTRVREMVR